MDAAGSVPVKTADTLAHLLLALCVVLAAGRGLAAVFVRLRDLRYIDDREVSMISGLNSAAFHVGKIQKMIRDRRP